MAAFENIAVRDRICAVVHIGVGRRCDRTSCGSEVLMDVRLELQLRRYMMSNDFLQPKLFANALGAQVANVPHLDGFVDSKTAREATAK